MIKQTKYLMLISFVISVCGLVLYAGMRTSQTSLVRKQLGELKAKEVHFGVTSAEAGLLSRKFPPKADTAPFVEELYELAKRSGLENVEITTPSTNATAAARKGPAVKDASSLVHAYQVRIFCEGRYPVVAQYLGRIRNIERYNRAVSFELKPDKNVLKTNIVIEIISFGVQNAS